MLEVLVAWALISLALLGTGRLHLNALRVQQNALQSAQAALQAQWLLQAMARNPEALRQAPTSAYLWPSFEPPDATPASGCLLASPCTAQQRAALDLLQWRQQLAQALPGAMGALQPIEGGATQSRWLHIAWPARQAAPNGPAQAQTCADQVDMACFSIAVHP